MIRFVLVMILMAIAAWCALMVAPWWVVMPLAFLLILLLPMKGGRAFLATGCGAAIAFLLLSYAADHANDHILSTRMAQLFHLPSYILMLILTTLIGFITAGLGGWTGNRARNLFHKRSKEEQFVSQQSPS